MYRLLSNPIQRYATWLLLAVLAFACSKDDELALKDDVLYVLSQTINGAKVKTGATAIDQQVSIELIFSHTLNTAKLQEALSFTGPAGKVDFELAYSNTNSTITLKNKTRLGYDSKYTVGVKNGALAETGQTLPQAFELSFTTKPYVPANVVLSSDIQRISENGGIATVTATLNEAVTEAVNVQFAFEGTAAGNGEDYTVAPAAISIPAGQKTGGLKITAVQDRRLEGDETISLRIAKLENAIELTPQRLQITIADDDLDSNGDGVPNQGFIINEVLFDPPNLAAGDANRDGTRSPSEDEFIEFINDSEKAVDISGFVLYDRTNLATKTPRHVFPTPTIIPAGGVYVLFGGGKPSGDFGGAQVGVATTGDMNLTNTADLIVIQDKSGSTFLSFDSEVDGKGLDFGADQAATRSPDINGGFVLHKTANAALSYSPGTKANGSAFAGILPPGKGFIVNEVLFDPPNLAAGDANGDGVRSASEDEFIEFVNDSNTPVDLSGFTLYDETSLGTNTPRHTFPANTVVPAKGVYVLFGGGKPAGSFGGAQVGVTTTGDMNLSNAADAITIKDKSGNVFLTFNSAVDAPGIDFGIDQAVTRAPDIEGKFTLHKTANSALAYSPGTKADGSKF